MKVLDTSATSTRLSELFQEKGYSVQQVAISLGVTPQTVYRWQNPQSKRYMSLDNLVIMCDNVLEIKLDDAIVRKEI